MFVSNQHSAPACTGCQDIIIDAPGPFLKLTNHVFVIAIVSFEIRREERAENYAHDGELFSQTRA